MQRKAQGSSVVRDGEEGTGVQVTVKVNSIGLTSWFTWGLSVNSSGKKAS